MCCLFGLLDYGHSLTAAQKNHILSVLSTACEVRGTDATGIAYNTNNGLQIYKRPLPAHYLRIRIPKGTNYIMGHTRMTTQGDGTKFNANNHPFSGYAGGVPFALAHNGVLHNDHELRRQRNLPATRIETDLCSCPADRAFRRAILCQPETDGRSRGRNLYFHCNGQYGQPVYREGKQSPLPVSLAQVRPVPLCLYRGYSETGLAGHSAQTGQTAGGQYWIR